MIRLFLTLSTLCFIPVALGNWQSAIVESVVDLHKISNKLNFEHHPCNSRHCDPRQTLNNLPADIERIFANLQEIESGHNDFFAISNKTPLRTHHLQVPVKKIEDYLEFIDRTNNRFYDIFVKYQNTGSTIIKTYCDAAIVETPKGLISTLELLSELFDETTSHDDLLHHIKHYVQLYEAEFCNNTVSPQQSVHNYFLNIIAHEITATTNIISCYRYLHTYRYGDYSKGAEIALSNTQRRLKQYATGLQSVLKGIPRSIRRCDPPSHKKGDTYLELSGLFQGVVIDNHVGNEFCAGKECRIQPEQLRSSCSKSSNQDCLGHVYDGDVTSCSAIGRDLQICNAPQNSSRQYEWIKLSNDVTYGRNAECSGPVKKTTAHSVNMKMALFFSKTYHCQYCLCTYSDAEWKLSSTRAISFMWQRTKISDNKVITGVRFTEKDGLIHIQAKEGILLPYGRVSHESWIPIDSFELETVKAPYTTFDEHLSKSVEHNRIVTSLYYLPKGDYRRQLHQHEHYAVLSQNLRTLNLNDVVVPQDHVITGIRLRYVKDISDIEDSSNPNTPIELEVEAVPFDHKSGKITLSLTEPIKYYRQSQSTPENAKRTEIVLRESDNPLRAVENTLSTEPYQFVNFQVSSYQKDVGQSTVPFFDAQPVEGKPGVPLNGVGIYYKGHEGFGGFIGLRIIPHDLSKHLHPIDANKIDKLFKLH